jgi:hypothetical protein
VFFIDSLEDLILFVNLYAFLGFDAGCLAQYKLVGAREWAESQLDLLHEILELGAAASLQALLLEVGHAVAQNLGLQEVGSARQGVAEDVSLLLLYELVAVLFYQLEWAFMGLSQQKEWLFFLLETI